MPTDPVSKYGKTGPIPTVNKKRPPRHKPGERFLKGPIPFDWLARVARFQGKALNVGIALWFWGGLARKREVKVSYADLTELSVCRRTAYRVFAKLERANLIRVKRSPGRSPIVTILDTPTD